MTYDEVGIGKPLLALDGLGLQRARQEVVNLTLLADAGDWVRITTGELDGTSAFMQGKLRLKGDRELAVKFQSLFKTPN
jgi:putative sterol carrier protein